MEQINILYEDNHLIAIDKPAGILVQGDKTGDITLVDHVKDYLKYKYNKPNNVYLGVIHRLDRPVSGLVLFAKTSKALSRMNQKFSQRNVVKTYYAIIDHKLPTIQGTLKNYIIKNSAQNIVTVYNINQKKIPKEAKLAELDFFLVENGDKGSLVQIKPLTGRSHQIRSQLAYIGCPIRGDLKYQSKIETDRRSICLHSTSLTFEHPVTLESITISSNIPKNKFWTI